MFAALLPLIARIGASVGARAGASMAARAGASEGMTSLVTRTGARMGEQGAQRAAGNLSNQFRSGNNDSSNPSDFTGLVTNRNK
jgi:predicted O-linked N-acetylglucosamine transferase (SPINDLY family)